MDVAETQKCHFSPKQDLYHFHIISIPFSHHFFCASHPRILAGWPCQASTHYKNIEITNIRTIKMIQQWFRQIPKSKKMWNHFCFQLRYVVVLCISLFYVVIKDKRLFDLSGIFSWRACGYTFWIVRDNVGWFIGLAYSHVNVCMSSTYYT